MDDEPQQQPPQARIPPPTFRAPRMVSRPKPPQAQEEEIGSELKLGDFETEQPLSISEARYVMGAVHDKRKQKAIEGHGVLGERTHNDSQSIQQYVEYVEMFARYKQLGNLNAIIAIFDANPQFSHAERALLVSLCCDTADEAKTLIPSLASKMDDDTLQQVLDELQKYQDRMAM